MYSPVCSRGTHNANGTNTCAALVLLTLKPRCTLRCTPHCTLV
jgi:hypothetical protein